MWIKKHDPVRYLPADSGVTLPSRKPTPQEVYMNRRKFVTAATIGIAGASPLAAQFRLRRQAPAPPPAPPESEKLKPALERPDVYPAEASGKPQRNPKFASPPESVGGELTPREFAGGHNNFYEFLAGHGGPVWKFAGKFTVEPWKVEVTGLCDNPMTLDLDDIFGFEHEERLYHFRCVERWAMNVPWSGFPLSKLIEKAAPKSSARHVRFFTALNREQMPGVRESEARSYGYEWPYFEALRLDEAMNELAFVATGIYGEPLLKQHGAPLRIVVPWKYGYKNPKSIVKIEFVAEEPKIFWQVQAHEYGYLSNVNPYIPHPRWSQATSHWLGRNDSFDTPIFNGYGEHVAKLYPDEPTTMQRPLQMGQIAR